MKILLKDPALVEAVIKKITAKYPCEDDTFEKYCLPYIEANLENGDIVMLEVIFKGSSKAGMIASQMSYTMFKDIPTDTDFLNDKEW